MLHYYFQLQIKILSRKMKAFGLNPIIGTVVAPFLFVTFSWLLFKKLAFSEFIYPLIPLYIITVNNNTEKSRFLNSYFSYYQNKLITLIENLVISFPFVIYLLFMQYFLHAVIVFMISMLFAFINTSKKMNNKLPTPFSKRPFEFPIGFRKSLLLIGIAAILMIIAIKVQNFNFAIVVLGFMFLVPLAFYSHQEPKYYVQVFNDRPTQFLWRKSKTAVYFLLIFTLPFSIVVLLFFSSSYLAILSVNIIGVILILISIIAKYSSYPKNMSIPDSILLAVSICIPPLLFLTVPKLYNKSIKQLTAILG